jgi:hypothetical protein
MSWYDLLILNTSILDLVLYPVLIVLVVVSFIIIWKLSKKVEVLQQEVEFLSKNHSSDDILPLDENFFREMEEHGHFSADASLLDIPKGVLDDLLPAATATAHVDGQHVELPSFSLPESHEDNEEQVVVVNRHQATNTGRPRPVVKEKYFPDPATPDISDEDARKYILEKVTGPVAEAVKKFPENWTLESLKQDKKLKNQLFVLLKTFQHCENELGKRVAKKLHSLLYPETSKC